MKEVDHSGQVFKKTDFSGKDLRNTDFKGAYFYSVKLEGANLEGANLEGAELAYTNLKNANLKNVKMKGIRFWRCSVSEQTKFNLEDLIDINVKGIIWQRAPKIIQELDFQRISLGKNELSNWYDAVCNNCKNQFKISFKPISVNIKGKFPIYCELCFKENISKSETKSNRPSNHGKSWDDDGKTKLKIEYFKNSDIGKLAQKFDRSENSIIFQIERFLDSKNNDFDQEFSSKIALNHFKNLRKP